MITENLSTLKIHKLTQEQYDRELKAGRIDENALYLTPNTTTIITENFIQQLLNITDGVGYLDGGRIIETQGGEANG